MDHRSGQVQDKIEKVKSADRALELFEVLVPAPRGLTHTELASLLGIPKSSLTKILSSLMTSGYVRRVDGSRYEVGDRWQSLVKASITGRSIESFVHPSLERLVQVTEETAGFNMVIDRQIETIATVPSKRQLQFTMILGERAPLYRMSSGLAILAHLSDEYQHRYYSECVKNDTTSPLRQKSAFERAMGSIRAEGFAEVRGYRDGIVGFGVPILTAGGLPLASLNVAMPEIRETPESKARAIDIMRVVAADLSRRLEGWVEPLRD
ncbi:MAG TPA: IclR family transcriptional regulator [Sphingomicrobium sp.]|nr:IclR family transcriptional regulator [Sphingomicrobium sp.]